MKYKTEREYFPPFPSSIPPTASLFSVFLLCDDVLCVDDVG